MSPSSIAFDLISTLATWAATPFGTAATAAAIVLGTLAVRLCLLPVAFAQHRADLRRISVFAKLAEVREDRAAVGELARAEGGGLLRGCLPMLVQIPVFMGLYQLFVSPRVGGHPNTLLEKTLFGVPLGTHLTTATGPHVLVFAALIALLVAVGFASSRLLRPAGPRPTGVVGALSRVMPYASVVTALFLPLAASLYLVTTTAWTVTQTTAPRHFWG
ncbi:protein translocase component YidC [Longispora fulva]|uniref:Membrane protein insertase YidC n=1 Tax=Longispora fulva TaxID=619741 RepID=A0A8J7KJW0_9ACTN|nr:YidC/Oxa1 family membrane protein insertase [Longispora fulva]MBG6137299.1 YidC/Oxa1 family membrane protein insertase [Longispora fulva]GIG61347.1 protein translocase component YidC [Longispora fulva]